MRPFRLGRCGEFPAPVKIIQRGLSIQKMADRIGNAVIFQRAKDQFRVIQIVFDEHDEDGFANHFCSFQSFRLWIILQYFGVLRRRSVFNRSKESGCVHTARVGKSLCFSVGSLANAAKAGISTSYA
jgi:hypothetical protein